MIDFAPGMRTIIRDEEWMVKKIETNSLGNKTLYCVGISPLVFLRWLRIEKRFSLRIWKRFKSLILRRLNWLRILRRSTNEHYYI